MKFDYLTEFETKETIIEDLILFRAESINRNEKLLACTIEIALKSNPNFWR